MAELETVIKEVEDYTSSFGVGVKLPLRLNPNGDSSWDLCDADGIPLYTLTTPSGSLATSSERAAARICITLGMYWAKHLKDAVAEMKGAIEVCDDTVRGLVDDAGNIVDDAEGAMLKLTNVLKNHL